MSNKPVMLQRLGSSSNLKLRMPEVRRFSFRHWHKFLGLSKPVKFLAALQHCVVGKMGRRLVRKFWQGSRLGIIPVTQSRRAFVGLAVRISSPRNSTILQWLSFIPSMLVKYLIFVLGERIIQWQRGE
ncbi:UNVERIFIED_CONTAM: hypothetical protein Slati_2019700 [Sesamum latifolium]|uniref:Uncharacterized protein n=1 Tax=Sesamum latifolium TaxID=2727402 RepID=A0AAW2WNL9_9LAMI